MSDSAVTSFINSCQGPLGGAEILQGKTDSDRKEVNQKSTQNSQRTVWRVWGRVGRGGYGLETFPRTKGHDWIMGKGDIWMPVFRISWIWKAGSCILCTFS